jgi:integrase
LCRKKGLPVDESTITHLHLKFIKEAGLRHIRLHDLRHLHATELLRLGVPLHVVSKRLGHADAIVTATIYAHVSDEQADKCATTLAVNARLA